MSAKSKKVKKGSKKDRKKNAKKDLVAKVRSKPGMTKLSDQSVPPDWAKQVQMSAYAADSG